MKSDVFPIGLLLSRRHCLVVGAGEAGEELDRRTTALVEGGAVVRVVAERPTERILLLRDSARIELAQRPFEDADLDGTWLAVLAARDSDLGARIFHLAEARRIFFCAVDQPELSNFSHLALARAGDVTLAVSTNGRAPALARRLREELERILTESNLLAFVERLARLRDRTASVDRREVLGAAVEGVRFTGRLEIPEDDASGR